VEQVVGGATLVVFVSLFLPWFGFDSLGARMSLSGTGAHGYLVVVALLAILIAGYLLQRSGGREFGSPRPGAPGTVLAAAAGLQFAGVATGFADRPMPGLSWEFGAYLTMTAAAAAFGSALLPVLSTRQAGPGRLGDPLADQGGRSQPGQLPALAGEVRLVGVARVGRERRQVTTRCRRS